MIHRPLTWARRVFGAAGIVGLLMLLPHYFLFEKIGRDYPPAITHPEFFYGFIGVAVAWQFAFLVIARDPARYRLLMIPAVLEKQRQVRQLQEQNANLQKQIEAKRERIERLRSSRTQQEMEIRERLKLLKEKETTFILQDQPKPQPNQPVE